MRIVVPAFAPTGPPPARAAQLDYTGARGERLSVQVLDHDMVRVWHRPNGAPRLDRTWLRVDETGTTPREGRDRADTAPFPAPAVPVRAQADRHTLMTSLLHVTIHFGDDFRLEWRTADPDGTHPDGTRPFAADLPRRACPYDAAAPDGAVFHYLMRRDDEHYFGFGEKAGPLDKRGLRMRMLNLDALGYDAETGDPLYKHVPFYITWLPERGIAYGLFYDNLATTTFDMGREIDAFWGPYRVMQADAGDLDYTLIYGPSLAAVVEKYTRLTGRPALLPRWAFGYLGSTMHYTDAPDAAVQLARFIALCREHAIPCDMFHLSSGYTTDANGQRNVFTWNRAKVPDPAALIAGFHDAGIRLAANAKPYLLTTHPAYAEAAASGAFIADPETGGPAPARFWSGGMNEAGDGAYLDFTSEAGFGWWQRNLRAALLDYGIDAAWNDNNEFELWDDDAVCAGFGRPLRLAHARPLHTLLMARASYEAQAAHQPDQRPFVLTRAGVPGIGRYAQTWTGDNATSWHTLRWNIPMGLGLGLSGLPHNGHDIGGFTGPAPDPELFARWVWNGIFQPRFAIHSWNTDGTVNEPWMHPSVTPIVRDAIMWRCRLRPLLYTLAWQAHTLGHPLARPLAWHFPNDPACRTESFDHLLGAHLLVASVFEPGARARPVYLPAGVWWCEWATGRWYEGGRTVEADAPLERIPVFVRAGAVLPLGAPTADPGGWAAAPVLHVYARTPGDVADALAASGVGYHLFEDDGASFGCARGEYALLRLDWDGTTARLVRVGGERAPHWNAAAVVIHGEAGTRETTAAVG